MVSHFPIKEQHINVFLLCSWQYDDDVTVDGSDDGDGDGKVPLTQV